MYQGAASVLAHATKSQPIFTVYLYKRYSICAMSKNSSQGAEAELLLTLGLLVRRLRAVSLTQTQELSSTQMAVIARLAKDGPATISDLARAESVKPQSMGTVVGALEQTGIVERNPDPTDGRQVLISLSAKGTAMRESVRDTKRAWLEQAVATLDRKDKEILFAAGEIIKRLVEL